MAEDPQNTEKKFQKFCEGMNFADMMWMMTEAKKTGPPFNCVAVMSRKVQMCCGGKK